MKERGFSKNKGRVGGKREEGGRKKKRGKTVQNISAVTFFSRTYFFLLSFAGRARGRAEKKDGGWADGRNGSKRIRFFSFLNQNTYCQKAFN